MEGHNSDTNFAVADLGEGPVGLLPLFLDQTKARRGEKNLGGDCPPAPSHLRVWMTAPSFSQVLDPALLCNCGEEGGTKEPP